MYTLSFGSKLRYHGLIFESSFFFFSVCLKKRGAWEERCWRSRRFHEFGRICFFSFIFSFFKSRGRGVSRFSFSILLLVFFLIIYISSSYSLFDIIRFFFGFWLAGWIRLKGNRSIAR